MDAEEETLEATVLEDKEVELEPVDPREEDDEAEDDEGPLPTRRRRAGIFLEGLDVSVEEVRAAR